MAKLKKNAGMISAHNIRIPANKKLKLVLTATLGIICLLVSGTTALAATQAQINASTTAGVVWLVAQQQGDGSWTGGYAADTGFALGALAHYAEKLGKTPLDPTYIYHTNVQNGLNYLFSSATYDAINSWVYWDVGGNNSYQTGPCIMGIARSGAPTAVVSGGALNGFTYKQVAQMAVDWLGSAQITSGNGTGAWYYTKGSTTGDQSATGWVTLGLGYAAHSMGCTLPAGLLTRLAAWNEFIQWHTAGPDFGGAAYMNTYLGWYNVYKTGHLLFSHGLCGSTVATARVQEALTFMDVHWADLTNGAGASNDYGWRGNPPSILPSYIAIAAAAKGFTELEIETFSGHDWYNDFADVCVANQWPDGHWLGGGHGETTNRSTCWALLGLLRATSHFPPMVTTNAADDLGPFTATLHGNLTDFGTAATANLSFQYGTTSGSLTSETTAAAYSSTVPHAYSAAISGLAMGTRYYFRAKAVGDATGYGDELFFDTLPVPTVTTTAVTAISNVSAASGGNVTADNGTPVTVRGVCWSTSANPTIADSHTTDGTGTGVFSSSITTLAASTVYHVRAYATNTAGTGYGADVPFTTAAIVTATAGANGSLDATTPSPVIVNYNSTTSFKFNAEANYHVASVSGCSGTAYTNTSNAVTTYTYTTGAVTSACTVTAAFAINQYTVSGVVSGGHGSVVAPAAVTVTYGGSASFTFNADTGYHVVSVSGCSGTAYSNTSNAVSSYTYTTGAISSDCTVTATFAINTYAVAATAAANGALDAATPSPIIVNYGATPQFTFNAATGYHVASVSGCSGTAYTNTANTVATYTYTTGAITADCTVSATFAINQYTVTASAGTNGTLDAATPSPITVNYGATPQFTFNAATGYHVASVSGCSGTAYTNTANTVSTYTYTTGAITADCTVSATFAINQYTVTAAAGANGTLDASTPSPITVNHGDTPAFTFNATTGYHVASITGCFGTDYSNTSNSVSSHTYTTGPVTADCAVSATFAINQYTVTATAGANGTLDASTPSPITVNYGDTPSFIFHAADGYHVTSASGCGGPAYANTTNEVATITYTTAAINADCAVAATFAINVYQVGFDNNANGHLSGNLLQSIEHGQDCTPVTAVPDLGYRLQTWSGDYSGGNNPLTIRQVTANMAIHAVFINDPPQVTIVSPLDGSTVFGVVTVLADIADDTRIAAVEFYVDNKLQERVTAAQAGTGAHLPAAAKKAVKEIAPDIEPGAPEPVLQQGTWRFDLRGARAIFLTPERKARKVDGQGLVSAIIQPDVDITQLQLLPQIHSLAVAFNEPQVLENGKKYIIALADFNKGELLGLEAPPAWIVGDFGTSQTFQTDGLNNLYYVMVNAKRTLVLRAWNPARGSRTVFASDQPIQEWQVAEEGAIILKTASAAKGMSPIRIWHPRLGWINENQSLLTEQTMRQWGHTAVSRGCSQTQRLESYFPQNAEIQSNRFDDIRTVRLLNNLVLIAGSQAGMAQVEILDRDNNTSMIVPTGSLEVAKAGWVNEGLAILAGFDHLADTCILARLQLQPGEPPVIFPFAELKAMPLQIQGAAFIGDSQAQENEPAAKAGRRKELRETLPDPGARLSATEVSSVSARFSFTMDTLSFSVDNHALRIVAYDDALASGADEITVKVAKVKLDLLAERRTIQAFSILRYYGQIRFLVEDFGIPAAQYHILRKKGAGEFELLQAITAAELQNNQFQMQDKYLEAGIAYTYRIEAYNAEGELYGFSVDKTI